MLLFVYSNLLEYIMRSLKYSILIVLLSVLAVACNQNEEKKSEKKEDVTVEGKSYSESSENELASLNVKLAADTNNAVLFHQRAKYYYKKINIQNAMRDISMAIQLDDNNSDFFVTLGDIYVVMSSFDDAESAYRRAIKINASNVEAMLQLAKLQIAKQEYMLARTNLDKIVINDPDNAKAYYLFGVILLEKGDTVRAIRNFNRSIDLDPESQEPYRELGLIYYERKDPVAIEYFNSMLNLNSEDQTAMYLIGMFYQNAGEYQNAENMYYRMIQVDSTNALPYYNIGYLHLVYAEDFVTASEFFSKAIAYDSLSIDAFYNRGYAYELSGKYKLARKDYKQTLRMNPKYEKGISGLRRIKNVL